MPTSLAGRATFVAAIAIFFWGLSRSAEAQGASYRIVAFTGQSAPGGGTYDHFGAPRIGADGTIGFVEVDSRGDGNTSKIYAGLPDVLRLVVSSGDPSPGANLNGGVFQDFQSVSLSKDGLVAFNAGVSRDGYIKGIWAETAGGLKWVADDASCESGGLSISALGPVGFRSGLIGAKGEESPDRTFDVLFFGASGSLTDVLKEDQTLEGKRLRKIYDTSPCPNSVGTVVDVNESGTVALKMTVSPLPSPTPTEAIYAGAPGAPNAVAVQNAAAPGLSDSSYGHLSDKPTIAANGLVAFSSTLNSQGGPASAIFSGFPGAIAPQVLQGATVPTTTDVTFGPLSDAVVNSTGDVIFRAVIEYPNETSRTGIWIQRKTGPAVLVAVSGINLPTPAGLREVTSVDFAGPGSFNDLHEFVFRASFGDDEGIYVADTRPGAPIIFIAQPSRPRDRVTTKSSILVAGIATDDTGIDKVEYTVAHEVSAAKRAAHKRGKRFITSRVKLARGEANWNFKVPLTMGLNLISITATDKLGNVSEAYKVRILRYKRNKPGLK